MPWIQREEKGTPCFPWLDWSFDRGAGFLGTER